MASNKDYDAHSLWDLEPYGKAIPQLHDQALPLQAPPCSFYDHPNTLRPEGPKHHDTGYVECLHW